MKFKKVGYVFKAGGYGGVYSVGPALACFDAGIFPWYVQGVSVGAINGGKIVEHNGDPRHLAAAWKWIEKRGPSFIFDKLERYARILADIFVDITCMNTSKGLRELVSAIDFQKVVRSYIPFEVVVTNRETEKREIFSTMDDDIRTNPELMRSPVIASASLSAVFPPVPIMRHGARSLYLDGYCPIIERVFAVGCDAAFVFSNDVPHEHPESLELVRGLDLNRHFLARLLDESEKKYAEERHPGQVFFFEPTEGIGTLKNDDFMPGDISRAIELGYEYGKKTLESIL